VTLRPLEPDDGGYVGADAAGYQFLLDFAGGRSPFPAHTFSQVLEGKTPADAFRDRIVLLGVATQSVKDFFATPFREGEGAVEPVYGVAVHAHTASQLIRMAKGESPPFRTLSEGQEALWILGWCFAGALLAVLRRGLAFFAVLALAGLGALGAACYLAFGASWWLPLLPPGLAFTLAAGIVTAYLTRVETAQRELLMRLFSRYVSRPLAADIWQRRSELLEGGRLRPRRLAATVLFSDVRGFTSISETLDPQGLMDWLSEYLGAMADLVHAHGGVVDKFVGDAVMAVFGLHGPANPHQADHGASAAVQCALAMRAALAELNAKWSARGLSEIGIRVGIHTGPLAYGTVGGGERVESTVIGDTVNIASRLESFDREMVDPEDPESPCRILVSADTLALVNGRYRTWDVGEVQLKGKAQGIRVFGLRGWL
jgi:adenylate cyclase